MLWPKISKSLLSKYQLNKSTETHYRQTALFYGYVTSYLLNIDIQLIIPKEIMQLRSDYFALLSILTRTKCYGNCSGKIDIKSCDCIQGSTYENGKYIQKCKDCMKKINCNNCNSHGKIHRKGNGVVITKSENCQKCKGNCYVICRKYKEFGIVLLKCICNGSSWSMMLDFEKLYKKH